MDIIFLIITGIYINGRAKLKGLNNVRWVVLLIVTCIAFELAGVTISYAINGGQLLLSMIFGFFSLIGGFLLIKYRLDKTPSSRSDNNNRVE